jgi:hypothetical protein
MEIRVKKITAARLTPLAGVGLAVVAAGSLLLFSLFAQNASQGLYDPPRGAALTAQPDGTVTPLILPALAVAPQPGTTTTEPTPDGTVFPPTDVSVVPGDSGAPIVPPPTTGVGGSDLGGDGSAGGRDVAGGSVDGPRVGWDDDDYEGDDDGKGKKDKSGKKKAKKSKGHKKEKHSKSNGHGNDNAQSRDDDDDDSGHGNGAYGGDDDGGDSSHGKSGQGRGHDKPHKNKKSKKR